MTTIRLLQLTVGPVATNCYLVGLANQPEVVIIDPGDNFDKIDQTLQEQQLKPQAILLTHGHFDHLMATSALQTKYHLPCYLHSADLDLAKNLTHANYFFPGYAKADSAPQITHQLNEPDVLKLAGLNFKVIATPGHTAGSVCFYLPAHQIIFTGDTLFAQGSLGRTDFPESLPELIVDSAKKILAFDAKIKIYPGHGEISSVEKEKNYY